MAVSLPTDRVSTLFLRSDNLDSELNCLVAYFIALSSKFPFWQCDSPYPRYELSHAFGGERKFYAND